uniref:Uncharacterized protein n=1 Tax=Cannabis sativa TaxID=3483 RepID=A0A803Q9H8_CANSA
MDVVLGIEPIDFSDAETEEEAKDVRIGDGEDASRVLLLEIHEFFPEPLSPKSSLRSIKQQEDIRKDFVQFLEANNRCSENLAQGKISNPPILRSGSVKRNLKTSFSKSASASKIKITIDDIHEIEFWKPSIVCYVLGANPPLSILEGLARRMWTCWNDLVWGEKYLLKIIGQVGKLIMVDEATKRRDKLSFPRVLLKEERGLETNLGGEKANGKPVENDVRVVGATVDSEGFQPVVKGLKSRDKVVSVTTVTNKKTKFFVTFIYGFNDEDGRRELWKDIKNLDTDDAWIVLGDFNNILRQDERIGNRAKHKDCVDVCT